MSKDDGVAVWPRAYRAHTFPVRFLNIFVDYPLGQMHVSDKLWMHWNKAPMWLWQTQLNFAVWWALSTCGVSSAHLNYTKHPVIRAVYHFHVYYHMRRVLKRLQVPLPHESSFNASDNPYTSSEFKKKFVMIIGFLMILWGIGTKNFIGLISVVFIGLMITLVWTQWLGGF